MCKSLVALLLALVTVAIVSAQYNVNPCQGHPNGFARDLTSCAHFYHCQNGVATRKVCPSPLHFDGETEQCLPRNQARCFACPQNEFRLLSVPKACPQYIQCFLGLATLNICPVGLVFDGRNNVANCNYEPYPGGCYRENDSGVGQPAQERCPVVFERPSYIHDTQNCSVYYVCTQTNEIPQRRQCDSGLHFNYYRGVCDHPESANCPIEGAPPTPEPTWGPPTAPTAPPTKPPTPPTPSPPYEGVPAIPCPIEGGVYVPDRFQCNMYHACLRGGSSRLQYCAARLHFDMYSRTCKLPKDATCYSHAHPPSNHGESIAYEREPQDSSSSEEEIYC